MELKFFKERLFQCSLKRTLYLLAGVILFLSCIYPSLYPANVEVVDELWVTNNTGLGTTAPSAKLHLLGTGTGPGFNLRFQDSSGADKVSFLDNGNVGIGTTNPGSALDVSPASGIRAQQLCDETGANCKDISTGWKVGYTPILFQASNMTANVANGWCTISNMGSGDPTKGLQMPWQGEIIGMSTTMTAARTAGTATFIVRVEGVNTTNTVIIDATNTQTVYKDWTSSGSTTFNAGDRISCVVTTNSTWAPTTADGQVYVFVRY